MKVIMSDTQLFAPIIHLSCSPVMLGVQQLSLFDKEDALLCESQQLYDIHGKLPALEAVLQAIRQAEVVLVVVGDDLVPGPMPRVTLTRIAVHQNQNTP